MGEVVNGGNKVVDRAKNDELNPPETGWERRNPFKALKAKPNSRKLAIHAMCASCMGCTEEMPEPGWRGGVRECSSMGCPLYNFRPFAQGLNEEDISDAD